MQLKIFLANENATLTLGTHFAELIKNNFLFYLHGDLGAGKTTLVRGFLNYLSPNIIIKSPTYTLVESYHINKNNIHHFDLYRIKDAEELELIGIRDYFHDAIIFIEWPENGKSYLPISDLDCYIKEVANGREIVFISNTRKGDILLHNLSSIYINDI